MQLSNNKGSVLIWSMFLSIIIAISFMSISTKIHKNIKLGGTFLAGTEENNQLQSALQDKQSRTLSPSKVIIFEKENQSTFSLKKGQNTIFSFSGSTDFDIDLGIIEGSGIQYTYSEISPGTTTSSGVVIYSHSFTGTLNSTSTGGLLSVTNLGGYTKMFIKSSLNFESQQKKYKIVKKIGNHSVIQSQGVNQ